MEIKSLPSPELDYESFLAGHTHLLIHTLAYKKLIEAAFGCTYHLVAAVEHHKIKTVFPFVEVKSTLFGSKIISSAYLEYGSFAGEESGVDLILKYLTENYSAQFGHLEIRAGLDQFDVALSSKLVKKNLYRRFVLPLPSEKEVWQNIQHSKRKAINKALRGVEVKDVPLSELSELYQVYSENMRRFGSPPYNTQYFISFYQNLVDLGLGKVFGSYHQGKLISALLGLCYQDRVHIIIAVSDQKYQELRPNDAMHWAFIQWSCQQGYQFFDFGRVRENSGQYEYKQKWGPTLLELPSYFLLWKDSEISFTDPSSPKYKLALRLWQKMPLKLTQVMGMRLRKGLGI